MRSNRFCSRIFAFCSIIGLFAGTVARAQAATYPVNGDVIGAASHYTVQADDNLYALARRFDLGFVELLAANPGVDPWMPKAGMQLTLPTIHVLPNVPRHGIVVNLATPRLFYFPDPHTVMTFPVGTGMKGWQTPVGQTAVESKRKDPAWIPPESIRETEPGLPAVFPPGPGNPLGDYAFYLGWPGYRIHGTNRPSGVGERLSHGCIRLYPEDIAELFPLVKEGTPVTIIDSNYELGWQDDRLWLEVTPTQQQVDKIAEYQDPPPDSIPELYSIVAQMAGEQAAVDWRAVDAAIKRRDGMPVIIARKKQRLDSYLGYFTLDWRKMRSAFWLAASAAAADRAALCWALCAEAAA